MFLNLYKSIVRPHLEYAATMHTPFYKKDMIVIENVQGRATKLVSTIRHLSYQERLNVFYFNLSSTEGKEVILLKSLRS